MLYKHKGKFCLQTPMETKTVRFHNPTGGVFTCITTPCGIVEPPIFAAPSACR